MPESRQREPREEEREGLFRGKRKPEKMEKARAYSLCCVSRQNATGKGAKMLCHIQDVLNVLEDPCTKRKSFPCKRGGVALHA